MKAAKLAMKTVERMWCWVKLSIKVSRRSFGSASWPEGDTNYCE